MVEFKPKDLVIVDRGQPTEEPAVIYMEGPTIVAVCALDDGDDRYRVAKSRLTKCDDKGNPLT
jgi:hypothetical protein